MSLLRFVKSYAQAKSQTIGGSITQLVTSWDPEGASEADIIAMSDELDKLVTEAANAAQEVEREQREAEEIRNLYNRKLAAIELLEKRKEGASEEKAAEINQVINDELTVLEEMLPEMEREEEEAREAFEYQQELDELCEVAANKLKQAKKQLENAHSKMKRAKLKEKRAEEKAKRAEQLAGIKKDVSRMSTALGAMTAEADKANARAEAMNKKAKLLGKSKSSSLMEEAMKDISGTSQKMSTAERLAALKSKAK